MGTKRGVIVFLALFSLLFLPLFSAEIIINQQPDQVYNLGSIITIPTTVKSTSGTTGTLQMELLCGNNDINFYKNGIVLFAGEQKNIEASLVLSKQVIGGITGTCKIEAILGNDYATTDSFTVSDLVTVNSNLSKIEFNPGESFIVSGTATRQDGKLVDGYLQIDVLDGNKSVATKESTVDNGAFSVNFTLPGDLRTGLYLFRISAYEEDSGGQITNNGILDQKLMMDQLPTNVEVVFENSTVEPGTKVRVKAILHDQTGENIDSTVFLTIKDNNNKIFEQSNLNTDEYLEFSIPYDTPPATWKVVALSNKLTSESSFDIPALENATIQIINETVLITNTGNVPYNKTVLVKIGNQSLNIDVYLKVDQSQKYILSAPDGSYDIQVSAGSGDAITGNSIALTGSQVDIKKAASGIMDLSAIWLFVIIILGLVAFIFFKKGYPRRFIGHIRPGREKKERTEETGGQAQKNSRAELALNIKGERQEVSMIALKVRNLNVVKTSKEDGGAYETLKKAIAMAEEHKAAVYENGDTYFLIFSALRTRSFKNEMPAVKIAIRIAEMLSERNKVAKVKVNFGISLTCGDMVAKQESSGFKFMTMGNMMAEAKRIASVAEDEILMGEKITGRVRGTVKVEKHKRHNVEVYSITGIKDSSEHEKFLRSFMKRNS